MVLLIQCIDQVGLVAAIAAILAKDGINIVSMREFVDTADNRFFARVVLAGEMDSASLLTQLTARLPANAAINLVTSNEKKLILLVTKEYHCLGDLLIRHHFKTLGAGIQCVIGNRNTLQDICRRFDIPFHFQTHEAMEKPAFESALLHIIQQYNADYLVLAKFMRILSDGFVAKFPNRLINIHHSFLPAFTGSSPYRQAFDRGVKLIGATAHFVTNELDEGPIISQQIIPVTHSFTTLDMVHSGKEIETAVLARALQLVIEDRVLVYKNKTIVFD